jgi:hypothetical protein
VNKGDLLITYMRTYLFMLEYDSIETCDFVDHLIDENQILMFLECSSGNEFKVLYGGNIIGYIHSIKVNQL